jgi:hypothetical protein
MSDHPTEKTTDLIRLLLKNFHFTFNSDVPYLYGAVHTFHTTQLLPSETMVQYLLILELVKPQNRGGFSENIYSSTNNGLHI